MKTHNIRNLLSHRILVLDGAMGTMIQKQGFSEDDYRGHRFSHWHKPLKGNNDLLNLTQPLAVKAIHKAYLEAGAHIITSNTFNANSLSLKDYGMQDLVFEINQNGALLACQARDEFMQANPGCTPRFVAGSVGPTGKMASMSPRVDDPAFREVDFDQLTQVYREQVGGLMTGGADLLLLETITDILNAKAALFAIEQYEETYKFSIPVMVSGTISDNSGRILSGHSMESFLTALSHRELLSIGLNCAFGARQMKPYLTDLSTWSPFPVSVHPNAGLPNQMGGYDQSPEAMAREVEPFMQDGLVNVVGGCCGTTPEHIRLLAEAAGRHQPRIYGPQAMDLVCCGLDSLRLAGHLVPIGERTNVSGSRKFARLIQENNYEEAVHIALAQARSGARMVDICMDDAMIDGKQAMVKYLRMIACEPEVARLPWVIDSSSWEIIEAGLKCVPGKPIVNSISLKEGEQDFLKKATTIKSLGAAVMVMLFDEDGQADNYDKRIRMAKRCYDLLTQKAGFPARDIVFDPNILAIGTGIASHNNHAVDFIRSCRWIKANLPGTAISGGISNLSFAFRGHDVIRKAMHSVFLHHARKAGLDMAILQPGHIQPYSEIPEKLRRAVEEVVLNLRWDATERLLLLTGNGDASQSEHSKSLEAIQQRKEIPAKDRVYQGLIKGDDRYIAEDVRETLQEGMQPMAFVEGPLMEAMDEVGRRFGKGEMFLPQVIKSARVMKKAVQQIFPHLETGETLAPKHRGKILLATVKGDVHDIGKNILSLVLECNGYKVTDMGVMVETDALLKRALEETVDMIGVSGLISPSLGEMAHVASEMQKSGLNIPLLVGGAATGALHTALHIAPNYHGGVVHVKDASTAPGVVSQLMGKGRESFLEAEKHRQANLRETHSNSLRSKQMVSLEEARAAGLKTNWDQNPVPPPKAPGIHILNNTTLDNILPMMDWTAFLHAWDIRGKHPELSQNKAREESAITLLKDAQELLATIGQNKSFAPKGVVGLFPAHSQGDDVLIHPHNRESIRAHFLRKQQPSPSAACSCLADYVAPESHPDSGYMGCFVLTIQGARQLASDHQKKGNDYLAIMVKILADCLVESFSAYTHELVAKALWGYAQDTESPSGIIKGIRPAVGYSSCPDHSEKTSIFRLLDATQITGIKTTENHAMLPEASVAGWYFAHPKANYFHLGKIGEDQLADYAKRKNIDQDRARALLRTHLGF